MPGRQRARHQRVHPRPLRRRPAAALPGRRPARGGPGRGHAPAGDRGAGLQLAQRSRADARRGAGDAVGRGPHSGRQGRLGRVRRLRPPDPATSPRACRSAGNGWRPPACCSPALRRRRSSRSPGSAGERASKPSAGRRRSPRGRRIDRAEQAGGKGPHGDAGVSRGRRRATAGAAAVRLSWRCLGFVPFREVPVREVARAGPRGGFVLAHLAMVGRPRLPRQPRGVRVLAAISALPAAVVVLSGGTATGAVVRAAPGARRAGARCRPVGRAGPGSRVTARRTTGRSGGWP